MPVVTEISGNPFEMFTFWPIGKVAFHVKDNCHIYQHTFRLL